MYPNAVILCGGQGTRIRELFPDIPKSLIPIKDKPYLWHCLKWLKSNNIQRVILALGYKAEAILSYVMNNDWDGLEVIPSVESDTLGTGGALRHALKMIRGNPVLVMNGDTLIDANLNRFVAYHIGNGLNTSRVTVAVNNGISACLYAIDRSFIRDLPYNCSLEDYTEPYLEKGFRVKRFWDIGTLEGYRDTCDNY